MNKIEISSQDLAQIARHGAFQLDEWEETENSLCVSFHIQSQNHPVLRMVQQRDANCWKGWYYPPGKGQEKEIHQAVRLALFGDNPL